MLANKNITRLYPIFALKKLIMNKMQRKQDAKHAFVFYCSFIHKSMLPDTQTPFLFCY